MNKLCKYLASLAVVALTLSNLPALSAEVQEPVISDNNFSVVPGESAGYPLDPLNPNPYSPIDPVNPFPELPTVGTGGDLSIDFISNFQFGQHFVTTKETDFFAQPQALSDGSKRPNFIQITDVRGSGTGWRLTAIQSPFETEFNEVLRGAALSFEHTSVVADRPSENGPTLSAATIDFIVNEETPIATAEISKGMGTWLIRMGQTEEEASRSVKLNLPNDSTKMKKTYTTKIQWILKDTP
ncbi:hypothetical protein IGI37_003810 [Enterococcus sp. AZ194]|uniref:WxL domain-containing protein n=1 Tax=Enterococcus sp. AZ194 TaxID=2774629 RepID=UPI003F25863E